MRASPPTNVDQVRISASTSYVVCYTAVFSVVTHALLWGGALRDDTKNGCLADYTICSERFFSWYSVYFLSIKTSTSKFPFDVERTESTRFNELLRSLKWFVSKQFINYNNNSNTHYIYYWHSWLTSLIININSQHRCTHNIYYTHLIFFTPCTHYTQYIHRLRYHTQ